jgi:hypothetical protein
MAGSRRLTRRYYFRGKSYGPETPVKDIPQELADREKQLNSPELVKKHSRKYGPAAALRMADLVPKNEAPVIEDTQEPIDTTHETEGPEDGPKEDE